MEDYFIQWTTSHNIFFILGSTRSCCYKKKSKQYIAFYSLFAPRRSAQKLTRSAFPVTKNENIWYAEFFKRIFYLFWKTRKAKLPLLEIQKRGGCSKSVNWILIKGSSTNEEILFLRASYYKCDTFSDESLIEGYNLTLQNKHCFKCFKTRGVRLISLAISDSFPLREQIAIVQY